MQTSRTFLLCLFCCLHGLRLAAQSPALKGRVVDADTNEALTRATTQLYRINSSDTTFVGGTYSDAQGHFAFNTNGTGTYLLRISFLGYKTKEQSVSLTAGHTQNLGTVSLHPDAMQLDEAVVTANLPKMA